MILKSIRLHPFGGTRDGTFDLDRPVAVVLGPNEVGKSTMRHALHHALFTPTKLSDAQAKRTVARWYPRPDGDHAAVTLVFEHDGITPTLAKRWGAGSSSAIATAGGASIADPAGVERKLAEVLGHNEATGRLVLNTGQADLVRTVEALRSAKPGELPPVADVIAATAGAAGDIGPERFRAVVEARVKAYFGRWDRRTGRPQLDNGRERGVSHPWEKGVGTILAAWYGWQGAQEDLERLRHTERELDCVSAELTTLEAELSRDTEFIATGGPLRDALNRRAVVGMKLRELRDSAAALAEAALKWPAARAILAETRKAMTDLADRKTKLLAELELASRRDETERNRVEAAEVVAAREAWAAAEQAARSVPRPAEAVVAELELLAERIKDARNRIEAQKLAYDLRASESLRVQVAEGCEPPREVDVGGQGVAGVARSRLTVRAGPLSLTVSGGDVDVEPLFRGLAQDLSREAELLAACQTASLADLKAQARHHDTLSVAAARKKEAYEGRLRGRPFEEWCASAIAADLPRTRDAATIATELAEIEGKITAETGAAAVHEAKIAEWTGRYADEARLVDKLVDVRAREKEEEGRLASLPPVPAEFESAEAFLEELRRRETANKDRPWKVRELATSQQQLKDSLGDRTAGELAETADACGRAFDRALREGLAYERILRTLEEVVREREVDPLRVFTDRVTEYFRGITGGVDRLEFDDHLPSSVARGDVSLPPDHLSQGGVAALSLALRLALAEAYLADRRGFVVLDDPLVDLDSGRRGRAAELLRQFATRHQVVFLTCHEPHACAIGQGVDAGGTDGT